MLTTMNITEQNHANETKTILKWQTYFYQFLFHIHFQSVQLVFQSWHKKYTFFAQSNSNILATARVLASQAEAIVDR